MDDASSAQLGTRILTDNGYTVQVANSKQEDIARLERQVPDVQAVLFLPDQEHNFRNDWASSLPPFVSQQRGRVDIVGSLDWRMGL